MNIIKLIEQEVKNIIKESRKSIDINELPTYLYHVTTNYKKVLSDGVLLAKSGLDSGGMGGTESIGVSFVTDKNIAKNIYDELKLINDINNCKNEEELFKVIDNIQDKERKDFILKEYNRTIDVYKNFDYAALMAIRLTRNSLKFSNKPYHGLIIFHEKNIRNKDIGIIKINKDKLTKDVEIIEGVDFDLGEIRVLGDVYL
jgi:hypothetical protein